jgi:autotransporter-associated beta strand protein
MKLRSNPFLLATAATLLLPGHLANAADGAFSAAALGSGDNDANVGLTTSKTYLHAINIHGGAITINGVNFEASSGGDPSGTNFSITGVPNTLATGGVNNVTGQLGSLVTDFIYNGNPGVLTLNGLTAGETYTTTLYNRSWDTLNRTNNISTSSGGNFSLNQDFNPQGDLNLIRYTFTAGATSETLSFTPTAGASFHFYGFSTEQVFNNTHTGGSDWSTSTWSSAAPSGQGSNATFTAQGSPTSINLDTPTTLGNARFEGSNTWTLSGASTLTLQSDAGALAVLSTPAGNHEISTPLSISSGINKSGDGSLTLSGPITSNNQRVNLAAGTLNFAGSSNNTLSGEISGSSNLTQSGTGTLTLSGPINHTGTTTITSGTLEISNASAQTLRTTITGSGTLLKSDSGTLTLNQTQSHTGNLTISEGTLRLASSANPLLTDNFSATGNPNTGDINFNLANRQTGTAALQSWTGVSNVQVGNDTNVNAPSGTNGDYLLLAFGGQGRLSDLPLSSANVDGPVRINFDMFTGTASNPTDWTSFTLRSSADGFPVAGSGELGFLYRNNTGIQIFNNGGVIADFGSTSAGDNFAFYLADSAGTGSPFAGNGTNVVVMQGTTQLGSYALNTGMGTSYLSFGSNGTRIGGVDNLAINNFENNLLAASTPVSLTASGATLQLDSAHQTVASLDGVAGSQVNLGTFTRLTVSGSSDSTFNGQITGSGNLAKSGTSTLTLTGSNTHTGSTIIEGGTINLTGSNTSSAITVRDQATLRVSGSTSAAVSIENGGTLTGNNGLFNASVTLSGTHAPGDSPGLQTFNAGLAYSASSILEIELDSDTVGLRGIDYDAIDVTAGNLTIDLSATLALLASSIDYSTTAWDIDRNFYIIDFSGGGSSTGNFLLDDSQAGSFASEGSWNLDNTGGNITLTWTAIPEPATTLLGALGLLALLRRRR